MNVDQLAQRYADHLREKGDEVALLAELGNSFEGWLKAELFLMSTRSSFRAGVEYTARLRSRHPGDLDRAPQKRVDVWVTVAPERHHYVELKVAFAMET